MDIATALNFLESKLFSKSLTITKDVTIMNKQSAFNMEDKINKKLQYYKNACRSINCQDIETINDIDLITGCMVNCKYSYDYQER